MARVLVPLFSLTPASPSGVTFVRGLLPPLVERLGGDVVVACDPHVRDLLGDVGCELEVRRVPDHRIARLLADRLLLPGLVARHRPDVLYVPDGQLIGAPAAVPAVVALHFHLNFSLPSAAGLGRRLYWKLYYDRAVRRTASRAAALLAPTSAFAREFEDLVPAAAGKLEVVPHGVAPVFRPPPREGGTGLRAVVPYVLAVTNPIPYKNLLGTLRIFAAACLRLPHELRLAGVSEGDLDRIPGGRSDEWPRRRLVALGRLQPLELAEQYRGASALLFPSLVESFGLPVLEAMACGTPVVASDLPAVREVAGASAVLHAPGDEAGFAEALRSVLEGGALAARLRAEGPDRARAFTWEAAASRTAEIIGRAADRD